MPRGKEMHEVIRDAFLSTLHCKYVFPCSKERCSHFSYRKLGSFGVKLTATCQSYASYTENGKLACFQFNITRCL